jgi:3-oxoadipate enol-lactonase
MRFSAVNRAFPRRRREPGYTFRNAGATVPHAESGGIRLYYETHGRGAPLLLIPGFGATAEVYFAQIAGLAGSRRVVVFDPRGAGRSGAADGAEIERADIFGTSFGGMVAQHLALEHPGRVRRLALGCTTAGGARHVLPAAANMAVFMAAAQLADAAAAVRSTYPLHYSDTYAATHDKEITARALANAHLRSTPAGRAGQLAAVSGHDTWERLPEIVAPTLVLHGDDDGVVPVDNGQMLADRIPGAALKLYEGARHLFFVERADEVNHDLAQFFGGGRP